MVRKFGGEGRRGFGFSGEQARPAFIPRSPARGRRARIGLDLGSRVREPSLRGGVARGFRGEGTANDGRRTLLPQRDGFHRYRLEYSRNRIGAFRTYTDRATASSTTWVGLWNQCARGREYPDSFAVLLMVVRHFHVRLFARKAGLRRSPSMHAGVISSIRTAAAPARR